MCTPTLTASSNPLQYSCLENPMDGRATTERLDSNFSLPCIGEGNGSPLQCSCLENPRDGGAWWVAVYGVTQSRTRLTPLSSSRTWKRPRCPSVDERIRKLWLIHTVEYYSAIKMNAFESVLMRWMNLEPINTEQSQAEDKYRILIHIYGI